MRPAALEIYGHLFASVAEEMGAVLQRSALSPNIRERLDYSCAVFSAGGETIAQAAHIPVHLGAAPASVRAVIERFAAPEPGAHILLNDPYAGGSHLPDLTLVTPVYGAGGRLLFWVASRAHHADVGGAAPGSLALAGRVDEEGWRSAPVLLSREVEDELAAASRSPAERRGDLGAQRAANERGAERLGAIMARRGPEALEASEALMAWAERITRAQIKALPDGAWRYADRLDGDGFGATDLPIRAELRVRGDRMTFDFRGSAPACDGPLNVPRAVTESCVLYAVRCALGPEAPMNGGIARALSVRTEPGGLLDARWPSAVAAGNVETSQRIADVALGALAGALPGAIPASSCGSMNNVLVGSSGPDSFAYYETIGGGHGAGPSWHGADGLQVHMTNTRNTPVEVLELSYPMRVERYEVRDGSGGRGRFRGGAGVRRVYSFSAPATVTLMTERRRTGPPGAAGGRAGEVGRNWLIRAGVKRALEPKVVIDVEPGDVIEIETPGGGGYGAP